MKKIDTIIIHCSATRITSDYTVEQLDAGHKARGFKRPVQTEPLKYIGYQYYIGKMVRFILAAMKMKSGHTVKVGIIEVLAFATKEVWMLPVRRLTPGHLSKKMLSIAW